MQVRITSVVHCKTAVLNKPGQMRNGVLPCQVVSCKLRGRGRYIIGSEEAEFSGPFMNLGVTGERDGNGLTGPVEMYWCVFESSAPIESAGTHVTLRLDSVPVQRSHFRALTSAELGSAITLFRDLQRCWRSPEVNSQLLATARLLELIALWSRPPASSREARAVYLFKDLIEQYADQVAISIADLSGRVGYSPDYLGARFQKETGMSPVEFRTRIRIARAREMLTATTLSIAQIARDSGFLDPKYFSRVFRMTTGMSPRDYANQNSIKLSIKASNRAL